jgi:hypothetical protein
MEEIGEDMEHWSIEDYKNYTEKGFKKHKYKANKTSIDGHTFDSQKEAEYYCELKNRLKANDIKGFCLQPTFILAAGLKYKADFIIFNNDGTQEIIDVKGFKTKEYITKKKVFEDKFNLKIKEI